MDVNKIFNLFNSEDTERPMNEETLKLVNDYKEHPLFKIGMFRKIIKT